MCLLLWPYLFFFSEFHWFLRATAHSFSRTQTGHGQGWGVVGRVVSLLGCPVEFSLLHFLHSKVQNVADDKCVEIDID